MAIPDKGQTMIGRVLNNRYQIEAQIGDGSTATVYRAWDMRLERRIALKVLLPQVKETTRRRFMQEAKAIAQFTHPGIMAIYDADEDGGNAFLVVEYVEGETLTRYIPSDAETVVRLGAQIADALHYAHERGVIHRDIKPANVMVTPEGQTKIMDLGLALARDSKRVTAEGMVIGTPAYISPEQAQGLALDARTDVYSLAVVLYEMVTGRLPFTTDDIAALMLQHVQTPPPAPRSINPAVPEPLDRVLLKAMEKLPDHRFSSAAAFAAALTGTLLPANGAAAGATTGTAGATLPPPTPDPFPAFAFPPAPTFAPNVGAVDGDLTAAPHPAYSTPSFGASMRETGSAAAASVTPPGRVLRLVLADDHQLLRSALVNYLQSHDDFIVVGEADNGEQAVELALSLRPDVLLLDLNMPRLDGLDALPAIRANAPDVRVLVLSGRTEDWYITQALRRGAQGYVLKSNDQSRLVDAIRRVAAGNLVLGEGVVEKVVQAMQGVSADPRRLNERERQLVLYLGLGYENDQIAHRMNLPLPDVVEIMASVMNKLGVRNRESIPMVALRKGEIIIEELQAMERAEA